MFSPLTAAITLIKEHQNNFYIFNVFEVYDLPANCELIFN